MIALRILWRLILDSVGIFLATVAAAATVYFGLQQLYALPSPPPQGTPDAILDAGLYIFAAMLAIGQFSWLIATAAIVVAEIAAIRTWLYYVGMGALSAAYALSTLASGPADPATADLALRDSFIFIAAGLAGGLVYWLVAGRSAGVRVSGKEVRARQAEGQGQDPSRC
jgi:hypothetical protein